VHVLPASSVLIAANSHTWKPKERGLFPRREASAVERRDGRLDAQRELIYEEAAPNLGIVYTMFRAGFSSEFSFDLEGRQLGAEQPRHPDSISYPPSSNLNSEENAGETMGCKLLIFHGQVFERADL
jgi:hypothetical protein